MKVLIGTVTLIILRTTKKVKKYAIINYNLHKKEAYTKASYIINHFS